jgi:hypothetical protein
MVSVKSNAIPVAVKSFLAELVKVWPNFHLFVPGRHALEGHFSDPAPWGMSWAAGTFGYVVSAGVYAVVYAAIVLAVAALVFQRRDLL